MVEFFYTSEISYWGKLYQFMQSVISGYPKSASQSIVLADARKWQDCYAESV